MEKQNKIRIQSNWEFFKKKRQIQNCRYKSVQIRCFWFNTIPQMEFGHQLMTGSSLGINFANQRLDVVKNKNSHGFLF